MALLCIAGCARQSPEAQATARPNATAATSSCIASHDGYLRARLRGAKNLDINWRDRDLQCEGGPRPGQAGVRLSFAGPTSSDGHRLRFVFGIGAATGAGDSRDVPANVTVIFEGQSEIYSTRGDDKCTIDELSQMPVGPVAVASPAQARSFRVTGRGFCVAPATAIKGGEGLLLSRFDFAGVLTEDEPGAPAP
jgi:hypothetical protein